MKRQLKAVVPAIIIFHWVGNKQHNDFLPHFTGLLPQIRLLTNKGDEGFVVKNWSYLELYKLTLGGVLRDFGENEIQSYNFDLLLR